MTAESRILPTSYSPSVLTTVAGNRVRGFVSQSEIRAPNDLWCSNEHRQTTGGSVE